MRKLALVLFLLLAIQSYGVYGASMAKKVTYTCKLEVGPLCYAWEPNAIGKILGNSKSADDVEVALAKARKAWEDEVVERLSRAKDSNAVEKALRDLADSVKSGLENAKETIKQKVEGLEK